MKLNKKSGAKMAMTAAALLVTGAIATSAMSAEFKGRCFGVNGCKGQGNCKTAQNDCKGQNACKGKGWVEMLQEECANQKGQWEQG